MNSTISETDESTSESIKESTLFSFAYANLFVGLLFVFCLILAAIVLKNYYANTELNALREDIAKRSQALNAEIEDFKQMQSLVYELSHRIEKINSILNPNQKDKNGTRTFDKNADLALQVLTNAEKNTLLLLGQLDKKEEKVGFYKNEFWALKNELAGISEFKASLILELQAKFDLPISTSPSGALLVAEDAIFEKNSYAIKSEVKGRLRAVFGAYFDMVFKNSELVAKISHIAISVANDELSILRANELLNFASTFYKDERLKYLLVGILRDNTQGKGLMELDFDMSNDYILGKVQDFVSK